MHTFYMWHIYAHKSPRYAHKVMGIYGCLMGIFVSGTYFSITREVEVAVSCFFGTYVCKTVWSLWPCSLLVVMLLATQ